MSPNVEFDEPGSGARPYSGTPAQAGVPQMIRKNKTMIVLLGIFVIVLIATFVMFRSNSPTVEERKIDPRTGYPAIPGQTPGQI